MRTVKLFGMYTSVKNKIKITLNMTDYLLTPDKELVTYLSRTVGSNPPDQASIEKRVQLVVKKIVNITMIV